jgi:hypothetical protein
MSKRDDLIFDKELIEDLSDFAPSERVLSEVVPWVAPLEFLTWGLIFTNLTLNFLGLQYILPTIGMILLYLGMRMLRLENSWFHAAFGIIIVKLIAHILWLANLATPLSILLSPYEYGIGLGLGALNIAFLLILRKAFRDVFAKAAVTQKNDPLLWVTVWTVLATLVAFSPFSESWLIFIPMVIFYIFIIHQLYHLGDGLDNAGFTICPSPPKVSSGWLALLYSGVCIVVVIVCCLVSNHPTVQPLQYVPAQNQPLRAGLVEMGAPEEVLKDLSDEELRLLEGAVRLQVEHELFMFDSHTALDTSPPYPLEQGYTRYIEIPGKKNLEVTTIYIELPEYKLYILNHLPHTHFNTQKRFTVLSRF